jgi:spore germination protein YaaH
MKFFRALLKLIIVIIFFAIAYGVCALTPYYIETTHYEKDEIRVVIDDNEYTRSLPDVATFTSEKVMLSFDTIKKYFYEYIFWDEKHETVIVAKDKTVMKMPVDKNKILVNGKEKDISVPVQYINQKLYIPIEELEEIFDLKVDVNEKIIVTTKDADYFSVKVDNKIHTKKYKKDFCMTTDVVKKGETIEIFDDYENKGDDDYLWVRTENGSFGYVKKKNIMSKDYLHIKNDEVEEVPAKISLIWEYAANYSPDRSDQSKRDGIRIVSPTWIYVNDEKGNLKNTISSSYLSWAQSVGYEIWPTIKNDAIGISKTSILLNDMNYRQSFVDNVMTLIKKYNFKGINLDFENMYMKDRDMYAELVRELSCTLRANGIISSVDVNVPDGSENWSLCYDSKAISDIADYTIVMAYDQYGSSSKKAGSVASLDWVELNLQKMIERDGIDSNRLVLGVPFYSRFWRVRNGVVVSTSTMTMKTVKDYMDKHSDSVEWVEESGQYVVRYKDKNDDIEIWVENEKSLKEKLKLISKYKLAGFAAWRWGFENEETWSLIGE